MNTDKKGRDLFYGIIAIATLIVAVIGATLAYFAISVSSNENDVSAKAATVSFNYEFGQKVTAQADSLIPSAFDVVQESYLLAKTSNILGTDAATNSNVCLDKNDRQVCSIYRFTISSDTSTSIISSINTEYNGFTNLNYAVYDVTSETWVAVNEDGTGLTRGLVACDNESDTKCSNGTGDDKTYTQVNSLLGYRKAENNIDFLQNSVAITNVDQTYDVILFLNEAGTNQNIEQGKTYSGTIFASLAEGGKGNITGQKRSSSSSQE